MVGKYPSINLKGMLLFTIRTLVSQGSSAGRVYPEETFCRSEISRTTLLKLRVCASSGSDYAKSACTLLFVCVCTRASTRTVMLLRTGAVCINHSAQSGLYGHV